jgi:hypothetical protein
MNDPPAAAAVHVEDVTSCHDCMGLKYLTDGKISYAVYEEIAIALYVVAIDTQKMFPYSIYYA